MGFVMRWSATFLTAVPLILSIAVTAGCGVQLSDKQLIDDFYSHRADFEALARMFCEDRIIRRMNGVVAGSAEGSEQEEAVKAGISPQRVAEYARLIEKVGAARNVYFNVANDTTVFIIWAPGLGGMTGLESKNIVYAPKETLSPIISDTDEYRPAPGKEDIPVYRHIDGPWYLQHSFN